MQTIIGKELKSQIQKKSCKVLPEFQEWFLLTDKKEREKRNETPGADKQIS